MCEHAVFIVIMSTGMSHTFPMEHVMGNPWETRAVGVEIQRGIVPWKSHKIFSMGNLRGLLTICR